MIKTESILKRSRRTYKPVKDIAEQYSVDESQIYKNLKKPEFEECINRQGSRAVRVDIDKYFEICQQVFR